MRALAGVSVLRLRPATGHAKAQLLRTQEHANSVIRPSLGKPGSPSAKNLGIAGLAGNFDLPTLQKLVGEFLSFLLQGNSGQGRNFSGHLAESCRTRQREEPKMFGRFRSVFPKKKREQKRTNCLCRLRSAKVEL